MFMPIVVEKNGEGERSYDLSSRMMNDRIIVIDSDFNSTMAHIVKMQLMYLDARSSDPIFVYISSPGGSVHDGLGIRDVMRNCRSEIYTICNGYAASMGCYILSTGGTPGKRLIGSRSFVMAHMVSSGTQGLVLDQEIALKHSIRLNELLMADIADAVGVTVTKLKKDCDRDFWMDAHESMNYGSKGFVDGVIIGERNEAGQFKVIRRKGKEEWI